MKRGMSKLLSILLIATLVFTSASVAFAGTQEGQSRTAVKSAVVGDKATAKAMTASKAMAVADRIAGTKALVQGKFQLTNLTPADMASETDLVNALAANGAVIIYGIQDQIDNDKYGYAIPVDIQSKGTILMTAGSDDAVTVSFGLYKDAALTEQVYGSSVYQRDSGIVIQVPSGGKYYIGVSSPKVPLLEGRGVKVVIAAGYMDGSDRSITSGNKVLVGQKNAQTNYFKFKAEKTGYLQVQNVDNSGQNEVVLCNSSKSALSNKQYVAHAPTFGVKKGTTYYLKLSAGSNNNGGYIFKTNNTAIKEKSGKNKKKAVALKKKKTVSGTIIAGNGQADWYKFKLTGKKKVKFTAKGGVSGTLKLEVYKGSKKLSGSVKMTNNFNVKNRDLSDGKWSKGTYYVKISRVNKKSSGYYKLSLSWK